MNNYTNNYSNIKLIIRNNKTGELCSALIQTLEVDMG